MEYKLFDDYITLQALLKETGIIQSGGAIKTFLSEYPVLFNGEPENRRGKNSVSMIGFPFLSKELKLI